ncbi:LysR family transcriptional regulator [Pigmentiphaga litoralis]|uniref:DNA-binding transcriptional LysR family regulator n=1 Tax=Pigmentiphaga litoralis TaxID=516702 RepID=A0A7Y9LKI7_9BURK|nr:LysR family transcriptional regulator [Pigmentiphaga litoralis]NYE24814.1 DNA-binding transcriptional LysR family regulator [Pigmentiphaga litoralis]NYE81572.1 DNA-binding transcriptional LysR family regulator [Pigmentiphaga litoralis]
MIEALRDFVSVATLGSFSGAARQQNVAVSSITRRIEGLETELRAKLFNRSTRVLTLTEAGQELLPRARDILAEVDDARDAVSALHAEPRGTLRVTAPTAFSRLHIAPALGSFLARYPLLNVELATSDEVFDLATDRIDVAIRVGLLPDSDLIAAQLAPQHRIVCASPAYLARRGTPKTPEDLLQHDCLNKHFGPVPSGWWTFAGINGYRPLPVQGSFRSNDTPSLLQAAVAGVGIVHLTSWLVSTEIASGTLVPLFMDLPGYSTRQSAIYAVRLSGRSQATKTTLFIDHLRERIGSPPYWDAVFGPALR